jgi:hypothetical protein
MSHSHCGNHIIEGVEEAILQAWPSGVCFVATGALIEALVEEDPDEWGPSCCYPDGLTAQRLGRYLSGRLGITSGRPSGADRHRGYFINDFEELSA